MKNEFNKSVKQQLRAILNEYNNNKPNKEKFLIPKLVIFSVTRAADENAVAAIFDPVNPFVIEFELLTNMLLTGKETIGLLCWLELLKVSKQLVGFDEITDDWNVELALGCFNCA